MSAGHPADDVYGETLAVFVDGAQPHEPLTAPEVAERLDCARRTAYKRLGRLAERGLVETKKVGARGRVWWLSPEQVDGATTAPEATAGECSAGVGASSPGVDSADRESDPGEEGDRETAGERESTDGTAAAERRYRTLAEHVPNGAVAMFDEDLRYTLVAGQIFEAYDVDPATIEGATVGDLHVEDEVGALLESSYRAALDGETNRFEFEWKGRILEGWTLPVTDDDGEVFAGMVMSQDVTEKVERERALERYRTIVETVDDGVYVLDDEYRFRLVNDAYVEMTGYDREALLGADYSLVVDDEGPERATEPSMGCVEANGNATVVSDVRRADGDRLHVESNVTAIASDGEYGGTVGVVRDVTARKRYEETLRALHRSSRRFLCAETAQEVSEVIVDAATDVLDIPGVVVRLHDPDTDRLVPVASAVEDSFVRREFPVLSVGPGSINGEAFVDGEPRVVDDIHELPDLALGPEDTQMRSAMLFPMAEHGVLAAGSRSVGEFDETDRQLVEILATNAEAAYDRVDRESRLRNQRDRLTALDDFNTVVREITEALVRQSTREEIETIVAERLADSDSYEFAWIGGIDPSSRRVDPHVEAGVDGYLEAVGLPGGPVDPSDPGPVGTAVRTQEMQVNRNVIENPSFERWRESARRFGYRAMVTIPIVHEGTLYGLLGIYSARPDAFSEEERAVVGQLGELVGLAIASVERKRALMSDELVELEFQAPRILDAFDVEDAGPISLDRTVPITDGRYLQYGTTTADGMRTVETLVDRWPHWSRATAITEEDGEVGFELLVTDPPLVSAVAAYGGVVESAGVDGGDFYATVLLPPSAPVREVVDGARESYRGAQVVSKRQLTRDDQGAHHPGSVLSRELTDRQRTALEAAFFAGYFEWPRDSSGEDVAASLGVSGPTFFYHVRNAERRLLERLFENPSTAIR